MSGFDRGGRWVLATLCAFSLVAAACGDDDDDDGGGAASTVAEVTDTAAVPETTVGESPGTTAGGESPGTTAGEESPGSTAGEESGPVSGEPIKVGLIYAETGRTASAYNTVNDAADAWVAYWNEHGGAAGRPVEVIARDMQGDVAVAAEAARELVETEGVVAVIVQDSNTEVAVSEYLATAGVPVIGGSANNFDPVGAPNTQFVISTTPPGSWDATMAAAAASGATHYTAIVCAEVPTCQASDPYYAANAASFGLDYTPVVTATHTEPSFTSFCLAVTGDGEDMINLGFAPSVVVTIAQECIAQGYTGGFSLGAATIDAAALEAAGNVKVTGYLNGFPWWADDPQVELYRQSMETTAPDVDGRNPSATLTWSTLELLRTALNATPPAADTVTKEDVLAAYFALDGETLDGLLPGPVTFVEGDGPQPGMNCGFLISFADGEFTTVTYGDESGNGASGDLQSFCGGEGGAG